MTESLDVNFEITRLMATSGVYYPLALLLRAFLSQGGGCEKWL